MIHGAAAASLMTMTIHHHKHKKEGKCVWREKRRTTLFFDWLTDWVSGVCVKHSNFFSSILQTKGGTRQNSEALFHFDSMQNFTQVYELQTNIHKKSTIVPLVRFNRHMQGIY